MNETMQLPGLPPLPKKRGRPSTGKALTSAQRKQAQRRNARRIVGATVEDIRLMPLTSLLEATAYCFAGKLSYTLGHLAAEILRRAQIVAEENPNE